MTRVSTGIPGFDDLVAGGFLEGSTILLSGYTGTGRTTFGLQYLYNGATMFDEPGIFVTLEPQPQEIRTMAMNFGWKLSSLEKNNLFVLIDAASNKALVPTTEKHALRREINTSTLVREIYDVSKELGAKRLVIDGLSGLGTHHSEPTTARTEILRLSTALNSMKLTSLFITEHNTANLITPNVEQFVAQGIVILSLDEIDGVLRRRLLVMKLRNSTHSLQWHEFKITSNGIYVYSTSTNSNLE